MSGRRQYNEDTTTIKLSSGGSVVVTVRGSMFDLTHEERTLIGELTKMVQQYKEVQNNELAKAGLQELHAAR